MEEIRLIEYAERLHLTTDEVVKLAAADKHISIPAKDNFMVNESMMKLITPVIDTEGGRAKA